MSLLYIRSNKSDSLLQTVHLCPAYSNGHPACLFLSPPLALPSHHLPPLCPSLRCQSRRCLNPQVNHCLGNSEFITSAPCICLSMGHCWPVHLMCVICLGPDKHCPGDSVVIVVGVVAEETGWCSIERRDGTGCAPRAIFINKFLFFEGMPLECWGKWNWEGNNTWLGGE